MRRAFCKVRKWWEALSRGTGWIKTINFQELNLLSPWGSLGAVVYFHYACYKGSTNINNGNKTNSHFCFLPSESSLGPIDSFRKIHVRKTHLPKQIKYVITNALYLTGLGDPLKTSTPVPWPLACVAQQTRAAQSPPTMSLYWATRCPTTWIIWNLGTLGY